MTPLLSLILLVMIAYIGAIFFHKEKSSSLILKGILSSGLIYLLLGYLIGSNLLEIINKNILDDASLLLAFVLGWTGFLIGLQINVKQLKRFQQNYYWRALANFCFVFLIIFSALILINYYLNSFFNLSEILILTTASSINSSLFIGVIKKEFKLKGKLIHFMQFHSAYDNMLGVIITGMVMLGVRASGNDFVSDLLVNSSIAIFMVIILALIFFFIAKEISDAQQLFLIIIGFILFLVGAALHMGQSSIFMSFIFGIILANLPLKTWNLFRTIANTEKPIYLLLLIFMGANLTNVNLSIIVIAIVLSIWRILGKYFSGKLTLYHFDNKKQFSSIMGLSGIGLGGLSLALGIDYHLSALTIGGENILFILAIMYFINDTIALIFIKPLLGTNCNEIK